MGKTEEQKLQEMLKRCSFAGIEELNKDVQDLNNKMKEDYSCKCDGETCTRITSPPPKNAQPTLVPLQVATQHLLSCEDHKTYFVGIFKGLIKWIGEAAQLGEDNFMCIKLLCDSITEFKDQERKFFLKIKQLQTMKQHFNHKQVAQVEELEKWRKMQKKHLDEVEKLLSSFLCQGKIENKKVYKVSMVRKNDAMHK